MSASQAGPTKNMVKVNGEQIGGAQPADISRSAAWSSNDTIELTST